MKWEEEMSRVLTSATWKESFAPVYDLAWECFVNLANENPEDQVSTAVANRWIEQLMDLKFWTLMLLCDQERYRQERVRAAAQRVAPPAKAPVAPPAQEPPPANQAGDRQTEPRAYGMEFLEAIRALLRNGKVSFIGWNEQPAHDRQIGWHNLATKRVWLRTEKALEAAQWWLKQQGRQFLPSLTMVLNDLSRLRLLLPQEKDQPLEVEAANGETIRVVPFAAFLPSVQPQQSWEEAARQWFDDHPDVKITAAELGKALLYLSKEGKLISGWPNKHRRATGYAAYLLDKLYKDGHIKRLSTSPAVWIRCPSPDKLEAKSAPKDQPPAKAGVVATPGLTGRRSGRFGWDSVDNAIWNCLKEKSLGMTTAQLRYVIEHRIVEGIYPQTLLPPLMDRSRLGDLISNRLRRMEKMGFVQYAITGKRNRVWSIVESDEAMAP